MQQISDKNAPHIKAIKKSYEIWGKKYFFETWKIWLLSSGSVTMSDTEGNVIFTSVWFKTEWLNEQADFFPLVVDFQEKFYATGIIWGNRFQRREARPSDNATLTSRLIDRPIRPMFPKGLINDTQILVTVLSATGEKDLWSWWISSSSLALMMTSAPFQWPVSGVKVIMDSSDKFIFDPKLEEENNSKLSLVVAWTLDAITMVEAWASEISDEKMLEWLEFAHNIIKDICNAQIDFIEEYKKVFEIPEIEATYNNPDTSLYEIASEFLNDKKLECLYGKGKKEFQKELDNLDIELKNLLISKGIIIEEDDSSFVWALVYKRVKEISRKNILEKEKRLDLRKLDEVREVWGETWILPRVHGSALFSRGMTQALSIVTLAWPEDKLTMEGMMPKTTKRYMHHYNFPPYSVGEVRMIRWVWRREIWHGALAERAIVPVLPTEEEFPYTIRVVSEITTCNGSSSMASVCGSTMSLMQAWVPIKSPVAWVAMWMIYDEESWNYKILSDIQAQEDFLWDMDFKLARTKKGITALQLDVKIKWLKMEVFKNALTQWEEATSYILDKMLGIQEKVSDELSPYAPLIMSLNVPVSKISAVIWKWWENVQRIEESYNVKISIEDDWRTSITAKDQAWWEKAIAEIKEILWVPEVGYRDKWKVVKIIDGVWVIVEYRWKNSWMIHISKLSSSRVSNIWDILKIGEVVEFEIIQIDLEKWRVSLKRIF